MKYKQLTQEQRYQIYAMNKAGFKQTQIAAEIFVHRSTVSRELRRNQGERGYRPKQAHQKAQERKLKENPETHLADNLGVSGNLSGRATVVARTNFRLSQTPSLGNDQ